MTAHKTRNVYIRRGRVSLTEVYYSMSEGFRIVYTNESGESSVEVMPTCGRVEVGGVASLLVPRSLEGWLGFERDGPGVAVLDARFRDDIHTPTQRLGS